MGTNTRKKESFSGPCPPLPSPFSMSQPCECVDAASLLLTSKRGVGVVFGVQMCFAFLSGVTTLLCQTGLIFLKSLNTLYLVVDKISCFHREVVRLASGRREWWTLSLPLLLFSKRLKLL